MKKLLLLLLLSILVFSCEKDEGVLLPDDEQNVETRAPKEKIDVCHSLGNGEWITININPNAWPAHKAHGDKYGECIDCNDCKFCEYLHLFNFDETDDFQNCEWYFDANNYGWYTQFLDTDLGNSSYIGARWYIKYGQVFSQILVKHQIEDFDLGWNDIPKDEVEYCRAFIFAIANTIYDGSPPTSTYPECPKP